jgi:hypothetical protein
MGQEIRKSLKRDSKLIKVDLIKRSKSTNFLFILSKIADLFQNYGFLHGLKNDPKGERPFTQHVLVLAEKDLFFVQDINGCTSGHYATGELQKIIQLLSS